MRRPLPLLLALALSACNKTSEPSRDGEPGRGSPNPSERSDTPPSPSPRGPAKPAGPSDVAWDVPATWTKAEKTPPMRKASYAVPKAAGDAEDGELSVSQAGGSLDQNIARWAQQLDKTAADVKRTDRVVNALHVTVVEIHGDYKGMAMPGAPPAQKKPGFALLGAIVETSPPTFFKLTGPDKTVMAAQRDFDRMVDGLRAK